MSSESPQLRTGGGVMAAHVLNSNRKTTSNGFVWVQALCMYLLLKGEKEDVTMEKLNQNTRNGKWRRWDWFLLRSSCRIPCRYIRIYLQEFLLYL